MKQITITLLFFASLWSPWALGQTTDGNIIGTVQDATSAVVPGAGVELENEATGVKTNAKTDNDGLYRFGNLLVGDYTVTVTAQGFTTQSLKKIRVELNKITTANLSLQVGSINSAIDVVQAVALLDTTTAQVTNSFSQQMAAELPAASNMNGGLLNLSLLSAGVGSSGGVGVGTGPSIGGQRPRNNNFTIEGGDNNRKDVTGPVINIPNDAVAEFTLLQNQFSAEFGHSSGGQFNTVVKTGTNRFHGLLYDYLRNRNFEAVDEAFARSGGTRTNPRFDENRLGGSLGGPIMKNKWFFYGLYEYHPRGQVSTSSASVFAPTAAGYSLLDGISGISQTNLGVLKQFLTPAPTQSRTVPVRGVNIPIGILPVLGPNYRNEIDWLISSDYNISDNDRLRGRYVSNLIDTIDTQAQLPIFFALRPIRSKLASLSEYHNFSPTVVNEVRLGYTRYISSTPAPDFPFPGLDVFPNITLNDLNSTNIGPNVAAPQATVQNTYQLSDNLTWVKGRHEVKIGGDARSLIAAGTFIQTKRGNYVYSTMDRFLQDFVPDVTAVRNVGGKPYSGNQRAFYLFANDNWRASRNLSINIGVRWEFSSVPQSMKEMALNSLSDVPGVVTFFEPKTQKANFAPRVGFAYTPGTSARTVIRGGFGIGYDQIFDNIGLNARPPQATSTAGSIVTNTPGYLAGGGILPTAPGATLTVAQARAATSAWLPDQKLGYAVTWNLGVQHSFANDFTAEIRYIGTRGVHLLLQSQLNSIPLVNANRSIPVYYQAPSQAQLNSLPLTVAQLTSERSARLNNPLAPYGFTNAAFISAYGPSGDSEYHGLAAELKKRFAKNLLFSAAYTWSHLMDNSTTEVNNTVLSPRRPQDFRNLRDEWATSALDRRQRFTFTWVYQTPWFKSSPNAFLKHALGGYQLSGSYFAESGQWVTPQSALDANQNGDAATDRTIINPNGVPGTSSDTTALRNSSNDIVAYLVTNPTAQYIRAREGSLPNAGRNTLLSPGINNWDIGISKRFTFGESKELQLRMDTYNSFNHAQYTAGQLNNVFSTGRQGVTSFLTPGNALFGKWDQVWSSNPRYVQFALKFAF